MKKALCIPVILSAVFQTCLYAQHDANSLPNRLKKAAVTLVEIRSREGLRNQFCPGPRYSGKTSSCTDFANETYNLAGVPMPPHTVFEVVEYVACTIGPCKGQSSLPAWFREVRDDEPLLPGDLMVTPAHAGVFLEEVAGILFAAQLACGTHGAMEGPFWRGKHTKLRRGDRELRFFRLSAWGLLQASVNAGAITAGTF